MLMTETHIERPLSFIFARMYLVFVCGVMQCDELRLGQLECQKTKYHYQDDRNNPHLPRRNIYLTWRELQAECPGSVLTESGHIICAGSAVSADQGHVLNRVSGAYDPYLH
jgi:hypothetical protein